jgi:WD40 repeat protein
MRPRFLVFVIFVSFVVPFLLAQQTADELRAEIALKKIIEHFDDEKADREKLRQDIVALRGRFAGTPQALKAAELLRQLTSPLDRLDPSKIRPLEVFDWQPKELVAVLGEHRGRQGAPATCVAYSPDRKFIASAGAHLVRLWDTDPKRLMRLIVNLGAANPACMAISPDSKLLAVGSIGTIYLFDLNGKDSKLRVVIPAGSTTVTGVAFDPKGKPILACSSYDTKVRFFDLDKKDPKEMEISLLAKHQQSVNGVAYSPDGTHVASASSDGTVRLWRFDGPKTDEAAKIDANPKGATCVAYNKEGTVLAAGCADGAIVLWNISGSRATPRIGFDAHAPGSVTSVAFSPKGESLLTGGTDGIIRQWNITKKAPAKMGEFKGHAGIVSGVAWASDSSAIASSSNDWTVRIWDPATKRERVPIDGHLSRPNALAFSPDAATLASAGEDLFIKFWSVNADAPKERAALKGSGYPIYSMAYAADGKALAVGETNAVELCNTTGPRPQITGQLKDMPGYIYNVAYTPDGNHLLVHHYQTAGLYDLRSRTRVHPFEGDPKGLGINGVALSADGHFVAAGSGNYLKKGNDYVKNKDGSYVYLDSFLRIWDANSGKLLQQEASALPVYGAGFSPDGRQLASGVWEPTLRFWELRADDLKAGLKGLKPAGTAPSGGHVYRFQFSPDGRLLLTLGTDNRVIVWDAVTKKPRHEWGLPEYVGTMSFAADSRHVAISLTTGVTYILRLEKTSRQGVD